MVDLGLFVLYDSLASNLLSIIPKNRNLSIVSFFSSDEGKTTILFYLIGEKQCRYC